MIDGRPEYAPQSVELAREYGRPEYAPQSVELAREYGLPLETVEGCIRDVLEVAAGAEGWSGIPDLNPLIWNYIGSDVLIRVEQHAEMENAA